ncbi:hypothetical protein A9Q91_05955 [Candidatus Gracilibacteria bacterium 28_42_T64]|nr:hypothetical protein A9Q91_05955 [Candidatus Gracilibacteria bacterium 28_42_T64]
MFIETVHAVNQTGSIFGDQIEFGDFILLAISLFVLAAGIFSIVFILWGGLLLILSGGKDDKIKPAINTIRYAIVGIIITVLTIFVFPIFGRLLGLDVEKYAEPKRIFEKIEELGNKIFGNKTSYDPGNLDLNDLDDIPADFSDL